MAPLPFPGGEHQSGWHASYWNTFLLFYLVSILSCLCKVVTWPPYLNTVFCNIVRTCSNFTGCHQLKTIPGLISYTAWSFILTGSLIDSSWGTDYFIRCTVSKGKRITRLTCKISALNTIMKFIGNSRTHKCLSTLIKWFMLSLRFSGTNVMLDDTMSWYIVYFMMVYSFPTWYWNEDVLEIWNCGINMTILFHVRKPNVYTVPGGLVWFNLKDKAVCHVKRMVQWGYMFKLDFISGYLSHYLVH